MRIIQSPDGTTVTTPPASWNAGSKKAVITVDGTLCTDELKSLKYTADLNGSSTNIQLGTANSAYVELVIPKPSMTYLGKELTISLNNVSLGVFSVVKAEGSPLAVTAYDALGTKFGDQYNGSGETTALSLIRELCALSGVVFCERDLPADVAVSAVPARYTRLELIRQMAALLGRNARINSVGELELVWYKASGLALTDDDIYVNSLTCRESAFTVSTISCTVQTSGTDPDTGMTTENTETLRCGALGKTGISFSCDFMTQSQLDRIFEEIGGMTYTPMSLTAYGNPLFECGDRITVNGLETPIMSQHFDWDGGMRMTLTSVGESTPSFSGTLSDQVRKITADLAEVKTIQAQAITADRIKAGAVTADKLSVTDLSSLCATVAGFRISGSITSNIRLVGGGSLSMDTANQSVTFQGTISFDRMVVTAPSVTISGEYDSGRAIDFRFHFIAADGRDLGIYVFKPIYRFIGGRIETFSETINIPENTKYMDVTASSPQASATLRGITIDYANTCRIALGGDAFGTGDLFLGADGISVGSRIKLKADGTMELEGRPVADFVTEQGTAGDWHYRKWNSGTAECWRVVEYTNQAITNKFGTLFSSNTSAPNLPGGLFVEPPFVSVSPCSGDGKALFWLAMTGVATAAKIGSVRFISASSVTVSSAKVSYYAKGRWQF